MGSPAGTRPSGSPAPPGRMSRDGAPPACGGGGARGEPSGAPEAPGPPVAAAAAACSASSMQYSAWNASSWLVSPPSQAARGSSAATASAAAASSCGRARPCWAHNGGAAGRKPAIPCASRNQARARAPPASERELQRQKCWLPRASLSLPSLRTHATAPAWSSKLGLARAEGAAFNAHDSQACPARRSPRLRDLAGPAPRGRGQVAGAAAAARRAGQPRMLRSGAACARAGRWALPAAAAWPRAAAALRRRSVLRHALRKRRPPLQAASAPRCRSGLGPLLREHAPELPRRQLREQQRFGVRPRGVAVVQPPRRARPQRAQPRG